jgi:hypothetical protein
MTHYELEMGHTEGFRYLGIKPPPTPELMEQIAAELPNIVSPCPHAQEFRVNHPLHGPSHVELGMTDKRAELSDGIASIAHKIANVLQIAGHDTTVHTKARYLGEGAYLFGGRGEQHLG